MAALLTLPRSSHLGRLKLWQLTLDPWGRALLCATQKVTSSLASTMDCKWLARQHDRHGLANSHCNSRCVCSDAIVTTAPLAELGLCNEPCELAPSQACGGTSVLDPILLYGTEAAAAGGGIYPLIQELPDLAPLYTCQTGGRPDPQPSGGTDILNGNLNGNVIGNYGTQSALLSLAHC